MLRGKEDVTYRWLPDLNHLFCKGKGMSTPTEYTTTEKHVSGGVIKGISAWIHTGKYPEAKAAQR